MMRKLRPCVGRAGHGPSASSSYHSCCSVLRAWSAVLAKLSALTLGIKPKIGRICFFFEDSGQRCFLAYARKCPYLHYPTKFVHDRSTQFDSRGPLFQKRIFVSSFLVTSVNTFSGRSENTYFWCVKIRIFGQKIRILLCLT